METEKPPKPTSLEEVAEINPSVEQVIALRNGFQKLLLEKGADQRIGSFFLGAKVKALFKAVTIKDESIPVGVRMSKDGKPKEQNIIIDIGMRTSGNERVNLILSAKVNASWAYQERSVLGSGFQTESPTKKDLNIFTEVLKLMREPSGK